MTANLARGEPLASAWEHAAKTLPIAARERETVSALGHALGGVEESVCAALTLAASELSRLEEELRQREREMGRITAALCLGGGQCSVFCCYNVIEKDKRFTARKTSMDIDLVFKIAAVGIVVAVLNQLLVRSDAVRIRQCSKSGRSHHDDDAARAGDQLAL